MQLGSSSSNSRLTKRAAAKTQKNDESSKIERERRLVYSRRLSEKSEE